MRKLLTVLLASALSLPLAGIATAATGAAHGCDYNGDGYGDLMVGAPGEDRGGKADVGMVYVAYGTQTGLTTAGGVQFHQGMAAIKGSAEAVDTFGQVMTCGDFNGDGYDDAAIGVPGENIGSATAAGAVNVLYGSASGLTTVGNQRWHQGLVRIAETPETLDLFGSALAAADFTGDGIDDLAIGVPGENLNGLEDAGIVHVIRGSVNGLTGAANQIWHEDTPNVKGVAEVGDAFGHNLAAGDFDNDGFADLAISAAFEDLGQKVDGGLVHVLLGYGKGLTGFGDQMWHQDSEGVQGRNNPGDLFGDGLAAGDFNADGFDDLAIGVPGEDFAGAANTGMVNVLLGSASALTATGNQVWHLGRAIPGEHTTGAEFGFDLAVGNVNLDAHDDLLVGVPGITDDTGSVSVILGGSPGLVVAGARSYGQGQGAIAGPAETGDRFGGQLTVGDYNGDGTMDAAIGALGEDERSGMVHVLYGALGGLDADGAFNLNQDTPGVPDVAEAGDEFGNLGNPSYQLPE